MPWLGRPGQTLGLSALAPEVGTLREQGKQGEVKRRDSSEDELISLPHRTQTLQKAKSAYSNYRTNYDKVNQFLCNVPNYEPQETDNIQQVETKLKNQAVILSEHTRGSTGRGERTRER